ncbi:MAG: amidoligase family protein [Candidatus Azobacteroides sp.]|nr:amidoligase family protein [Candidatus Azobacteroides sp.]
MTTRQINKVLKSNLKKEEKKDALIQIGLTEEDVTTLFELYEAENDVLYTIGVEIECYGADKARFTELCKESGVEMTEESYNHETKSYFKIVSDSSITGSDPIEVVSPVLCNSAGIDNLEKVCKALNDAGARVNRSTGLHAHFGLQNISFNTYKNVFVNYMYLEQAINKMVAPSRRAFNSYCKGFEGKTIEKLKECTDHEEIQNYFGNDRYYKVNPISYRRHNTVEFRQHQGTTNFVKIRSWLLFLTYLIKWSEKHILTDYVNEINDIPAGIMTKKEKQYFINRAAALA